MNNPDALVKFAVMEIIQKINSGLSPQTATEKVAEELKLNHNFIKRASEAVNVALHHTHFKKNPEKKAEEFPLVDAQKVAEVIYGGKEKTAGEYKSELFSAFQTPELPPKFARYLEAGPHRQVYEQLANEKPTVQTTSEKGLYDKTAGYVRDLKKIAENKLAESIEADYQTNSSFCAILKKFAHDPLYRTSWDEFESQVFSKHGSTANEYLDLLYKSAHTKEPRGKHDTNYKMFEPCKEAELFDDFFNKVDQMHKLKKEASAAQSEFNEAKRAVKEVCQKVGCALFNQEKEAQTGSILEQLEKSMKQEREKVAAISEEDPVMASIKLKKIASLDKSDELHKAAIDYIDNTLGVLGKDLGNDLTEGGGKPSLSATTNSPSDNRDRAILLQELATTDPILSKLPTEKVVGDYQQLLRIAPELSREKEVTRSILRTMGSSQALGPFDAQQLIDANTKLFKQHQLQQGLPTSKDGGGKGE